MSKRRICLVFLLVAVMQVPIVSTGIHRVGASGTIYIRADGSVEGTDKIVCSDNVTYTFTDNINDSIVVQRNDIVIDGNGYTLQGAGSGTGIDLNEGTRAALNVTVRNTSIQDFYYGIYCYYYMSYNNSISGNTLRDNQYGIYLLEFYDSNISGNNLVNNYCGITVGTMGYSHNNIISDNSVVNSTSDGISIGGSDSIVSGNHVANNSDGISIGASGCIIYGNNIVYNRACGIYASRHYNITIFGNNITHNQDGIYLSTSHLAQVYENILKSNDDYGIHIEGNNNTIHGNIIEQNEVGVYLDEYSSYNMFYNNSFIDNEYQAVESSYRKGHDNVWDIGFPSGGNYWSDYEERYPNAEELDGSGIWDTPYVIDDANQDNYPIIPEFPFALILPLFMILSAIAVASAKRPAKKT